MEQRRISQAERIKIHREDSLALKIAVLPTLDCLPLYVAVERVMYDTAQLDLRLKRFTAQMDCDTAIVGRSVEGMVSDLVRTERLNDVGVPMAYVTSTDTYWQLWANHKARIKRLEQLGDKMVAMTRYSATDFLTDYVLDGIKTSSTVFRIQVNDVNIRLAMLQNNEMDAMWLTEPQATAARLSKASKIYDSKDTKLNLGVIAFRKDVLNDDHRKKQIKCFVEAYDMACDSINRFGIKHYKGVLFKYYKIDDRVVNALPKLKFSKVQKPKQKYIDAIKSKKK